MMRLILWCLAVLGSTPAQACDAAVPCAVEGGAYRFLLPDTAPDARLPGALVFVHGHRSSAQEMLAYAGLVEAARALHMVLVVPQGLNDTWSTPGSPTQGRDEVAFLRRVLDDLPRRIPFDPQRVVLSGFSQGASVVWHVACAGEPRVRAYVPIAGVWWHPMPASCPGPPVNLLHIHGLADPVMPMAGRRLRDIWQQGDVREAIRLMARHNGCAGLSAPEPAGPLSCAHARSCAAHSSLTLCLHEGDHHTDPSWFVALRARIEAMLAR